MDLSVIYRAFNADEPLPSADDPRHVDLSEVWGSPVASKLVQRIKNADETPSHQLLMGHTKCGKTTELNRAARLLQQEGYATVSFDVAEVATRTFEYTTVLLIMAGQIVDQLGTLGIQVEGAGTDELMNFLREQEVTTGREVSGDITGKAEGKPGFLTRLLADFSLGVELRGGFARSREITTKIEANYDGFLDAIKNLVLDAKEKVFASDLNYKGLVVICDGCDKLAIQATDEKGTPYDLQSALFVDHASDLRAVPCHIIYTAPISIPVNFGDSWEQSPEVIPAIPVTRLPGIEDSHPAAGRAALKEVVRRRLAQKDASIEDLFTEPGLLEKLIDVSGGHISDLLLLVREAVLDAQTSKADKLEERHIKRSVLRRAQEYTRLVESKFLETLATVDQFKLAPSNSNEYRELVFKRLVLEYVCDTESRVDLHPLVASSAAYQGWRRTTSDG